MSCDDEAARQRRFELLLLDYEMARDDDRTSTSTQAAMFGIAVTLLSIMPLLTQTCAVKDEQPCVNVPDWLIAAIPMAPIGLVGFLVSIGVVSTIRSYYARAIEAELQRFAGGDLSTLPVPPASYMRIAIEIVSLRRGRRSSRLLFFLILAATFVVFGGITGYILLRLEPLPRFVSISVYSAAAILLVVEALRASIGGRGLFDYAVRRYLINTVRFPDVLRLAQLRERSLLGYLVLPRPQDIIKWLFLPASFVIGLWAVHPGTTVVAQLADRGLMIRFAVVFAITELLLYQARYQWNDIRGLGEDLKHPVPKARLPVGLDGTHARRNVIFSEVVAVLRIAAAAAVAILLGGGLPFTTAVLFAVVFGVAAVYEWLRSRRPAEGDEFRTTRVTLAIWTLVGAGYAVRGVTGLILAGVPARSPMLIIAAMALLAFGTMFVTVTVTWTLDASSYCFGTPERASVDFVPALLDKSHLAALLPYVGATRGRPVGDRPPGSAGARAMPLRDRGRIATPWNVAMLISGTAAGALGVGLAVGWTLPGGPFPVSRMLAAGQPTHSAATELVALGAVAGLLAAWAVVLARQPGERWLCTVVVPAIVVDGLWPVAGGRSLLFVLPWTLFAAWFTWFRTQSLQALKDGLRPLLGLVVWTLARTGRLVVGQRTADLLSRAAGPRGH